MSRKPKGFNIPWIFIVLPFVFGAWPIGILLAVLRELPLGNRPSASETSQQTEKITDKKVKTASVQKNTKSKKSKKPARITVLQIVAIALVVLGIVSGLSSVADMIAYGFADYYIKDIIVAGYFVAGGIISGVVAQIMSEKNRRTTRYAALIGDKESISLTKLSSATSQKLSRVKRDLQGMIDDGYFGDLAYIDHSNLCFMRTPDAKPDGVMQEMEAHHHSMASVASDLGASSVCGNGGGAELSDYDTILKKIRCLDDEIQDEAVSAKIRRIESITRHIFTYISERPQKKSQPRMFMNYYLPTTLKLLESYKCIEQVGVAGQNMQETKRNIEKIMDMLVVGFEQQMDQLFKDESMDITSDIEVLEQMMNRDGLTTHSDFTVGNEYTDEITDDLQQDGAATEEQSADV